MVILNRGRDVTEVTVTEDDAAFFNTGSGELLHRCLLDIVRGFHLEIFGMDNLIQRLRHENCCLLHAPAMLLVLGSIHKEGFVRLNRSTESRDVLTLGPYFF